MIKFTPEKIKIIRYVLERVSRGTVWNKEEKRYYSNNDWICCMPGTQKKMLAYLATRYLDYPIFFTAQEALVLGMILGRVNENLKYNKETREYEDCYLDWILSLNRQEWNALTRVKKKLEQ